MLLLKGENLYCSNIVYKTMVVIRFESSVDYIVISIKCVLNVCS